MDDTPDKIRRNLVFVSVALILSKFLGVNFSGANLPILGDTLSVIGEKERIWWAILFLWCYFAYRFVSLKNTQRVVINYRKSIQKLITIREKQDKVNAVKRAASGKKSLIPCYATFYFGAEKFPFSKSEKLGVPIEDVTMKYMSVTKKERLKDETEWHTEVFIKNEKDNISLATIFFKTDCCTVDNRHNLPEFYFPVQTKITRIRPLYFSWSYAVVLLRTAFTEKFAEVMIALVIALCGLVASLSYIVNPPHLAKPTPTWCQPMKYADAERFSAK